MARSSSGSTAPRELVLFACTSIRANIRRSIAISIDIKRELGPAGAGPGVPETSAEQPAAALGLGGPGGQRFAQLGALIGREDLQRFRRGVQSVLLHGVFRRALPVDDGLCGRDV